MKIILIILILFFQIKSLFAVEYTNADLQNKIPFIKNYLIDCSSSLLNETRYRYENDSKEYLAVFKGENLNLDCLKDKYTNHLKKFRPPNYNIYADIFREGNKGYITTLLRNICVNKYCLDEDKILFRENTYWYFYDLYNVYGLDFKEIDNLDAKILIEFFMGTHTRNILFDLYSYDFTYLVDGYDLTFEKNFYYTYQAKGYFPNQGGAFWYNAKRDYKNNIIELIDTTGEYATCKIANDFSEKGQISKFMIENDISSFCVSKLN